MAKQSQTEVAVLAALSIEPMTGYALREAITTQLGSFWSESFGQIYPALARLRAAGLVEAQTGSSGSAAPHQLTPAGHARLLELLLETAEPQAPRNGTLLRLFFGNVLGPSACRTLIAGARERATAHLTALAVARTEAEGALATSPQAPFWLITISAGEHAARAQLAWASEADEVLAHLEQRGQAR